MIRAIAVLALLAAPAMAASAPNASGAKLPVADPKCLARYAAIGLPIENSETTDARQVVLCRTAYALSFNLDTRNPDWAVEHLTAANYVNTVKRTDNFKEDPDLAKAQPPGMSSTPDDYDKSGYDQGHQAPADDFTYNAKAMNESFYQTNMSPQVPTLNRGLWRGYEQRIQKWIVCGKATELYVITGPVYGGSKTKIAAWPSPTTKIKTEDQAHRVLVPEYYFKIIFDPAASQSLAIEVPNQVLTKPKPENYITTIAHIEESTGLTFLSGLGTRAQHQQEGVKGTLWGHDSC